MIYLNYIIIFFFCLLACKDPQVKNASTTSDENIKKKVSSEGNSTKNDENEDEDEDDEDDEEPEGGVPDFKTASLGNCFNKECAKNILEDPNDEGKIYKMKSINFYTPLYLDYRVETAAWKKDITKATNICGNASNHSMCRSVFAGPDDAADDSSEFSVWQPIVSAAANADELLNDENYTIIGQFAKKFSASEDKWTPTESTGVIALRYQLDEETAYFAWQPPIDYQTIWYNMSLDATQVQKSCSGSDAAKWPQSLYCQNLGQGAVITSEQSGAPELYRDAISKSITIWKPIASADYECIADIISLGEDKPQFSMGAAGQFALGMGYSAFTEMQENLQSGVFASWFDSPTKCFPKKNLVKGTIDKLIASASDPSHSDKIISIFSTRARNENEPSYDNENIGLTIPGFFITLRGTEDEIRDQANKILNDDPNNPPKRYAWVLKKELVKVMAEEGIDPNVIDLENHWGR